MVFRATDLRLDRTVALKLVAAELAEDPAFAERFKRESRLAAALDHPNVIPIYHAGEEDGRLFVTMRFVEGTDLAGALRRDRRLSPERTAAIIAQVAAALDAAHARGLVHRDVKPANILLEQRGEAEHVFLTDFGLSKHARSDSGLTETGSLLGTVDYIAPEQVDGGEADARSDIYALGCVMHQMLAGRVPFDKPSSMAKLYAHVHEEPPQLTDVPPALAAVVARAMEKDPGRRYRSAGELARAAADAVGVALPSLSSGPVQPPRRRRPPRPALIAAAAAVVALAVAGALAATGGNSGDDGGADDRTAIEAVLRRLHRGYTKAVCRQDLTQNAVETYFDPRRGEAARIACENFSGGPPNERPFVVSGVQVQGDTARARMDVANEPVTFFLVQRQGRWRVDDFTETPKGRFQRQVSSAIVPSERESPKLDALATGELRLEEAGNAPAQSVRLLTDMRGRLRALNPPPGFDDIHKRLLAGASELQVAARAAVAAQRAGDARAFRTAGQRLLAGLRTLGGALGEIERAE